MLGVVAHLLHHRMVAMPIDVDAILAELPDEYSDPGVDPWGGASLNPGTDYDD